MFNTSIKTFSTSLWYKSQYRLSEIYFRATNYYCMGVWALQFLAMASFQNSIPVLVGGALQTTDVTAAMSLFYIQFIILVSEVLFVCVFFNVKLQQYKSQQLRCN